MATVITAGNATNGLSLSADNFGAFEFKTGTGAGTTALTLSSAQVVSIPGNLSFNSGYGSAAVAYGCRAWVNFNGTGTVAIRASGNVTSITDNGTGNYTVNFTNAMPDANYTAQLSIGSISGGSTDVIPFVNSTSTSSVQVYSVQAVFRDATYVGVAIFR